MFCSLTGLKVNLIAALEVAAEALHEAVDLGLADALDVGELIVVRGQDELFQRALLHQVLCVRLVDTLDARQGLLDVDAAPLLVVHVHVASPLFLAPVGSLMATSVPSLQDLIRLLFVALKRI